MLGEQVPVLGCDSRFLHKCDLLLATWQPGNLATCWQPGDLLATGVASCCQLLPVTEPRDWLLLLATAGNSWQQLATAGNLATWQPGNLATWQPSGNLLATSAGNLATRGSSIVVWKW